jgi:FkbM family methyltransferase
MYYANPFQLKGLSRVYRSFVRPGALCFDIGAHVGSHTALLLGLGARVVCLEPQGQCMWLLRRRFGADSRVILVEAAVSDAPGQGILLVSQRTPTLSTLCADWIRDVGRDPDFQGVEWDLAREVSVVTLDGLIGRFGVPSFCKIDVEGAEALVLRGLSRPIATVCFEYIPAAMERAIESIRELDRAGEYEYNRTAREGRPLEEREWLTGNDMKICLAGIPPRSRSGDVFARLKEQAADTGG